MPISNPGGGSSLWAEISNTTLAAAGTFDISGIEQIYVYLYGVFKVRSDVAATGDVVFLQFNNDTTATNYSSQDVGSGTITVSSPRIGTCPAATATAGYFNQATFTIAFYTNSMIKTAFVNFQERRSDGGVVNVGMVSLYWEDTSAITRIQLKPDGADEFEADSQFVLYGVGTA